MGSRKRGTTTTLPGLRSPLSINLATDTIAAGMAKNKTGAGQYGGCSGNHGELPLATLPARFRANKS